MKTGLIYLHKNVVNNKLYIGQTINTIESRWKGHKKSVLSGSELYFHRSMRKHGLYCWEHTILEDNIPLSQLDDREIYWIKHYNTYSSDHYNLTPGGCGFQDRIVAKNIYTGEIDVYDKSEFITNIDLVGIQKGLVNCYDRINNTYTQCSKEEFSNNQNLVGVTSGLVTVYDNDTEEYIQISSQDYDRAIHTACRKGQVSYINVITGETGSCSKQDFDNNIDLVGVKTKQVATPYGVFHSFDHLINYINNTLNLNVNLHSLKDVIRKNITIKLPSKLNKELYKNRFDEIKDKSWKELGWYIITD